MLVKYEMDLLERTDLVNEQLARYGVKFGIYKKIQISFYNISLFFTNPHNPLFYAGCEGFVL